jgi:glycosyltransferase involved in cell wall biosynthesis
MTHPVESGGRLGAVPIRVGIVAPTFDILGGHAVQAAHLLRGWQAERDVDVRLVPINPRPPSVFRRLQRVRYLRTAVTQLSYWPLLLRELQRVDIVHVFVTSNSSFFLSALPALLVAKAHSKRIVAHYHGDGGGHLSRSAIARAAMRMADRRVVPSGYFYRIFATHGLGAEIVPNVADLTRFRYRTRGRLTPHVLSTRNFEPIYNVACTLRAFIRVQAVHPDATLTLVGSGSQEHELRSLAARLGLRNVTFAGRVPHHEIHARYDAADIYVQTPTIDNMPCSVMEAFASGLPVVATRVGGVPAMIEDGVHGVLADEDDDAGIAAQVLALMREPSRARRMAVAARTRCAAYDWGSVREQWRAIYRALARSQERSPPGSSHRQAARQASDPPRLWLVSRRESLP